MNGEEDPSAPDRQPAPEHVGGQHGGAVGGSFGGQYGGPFAHHGDRVGAAGSGTGQSPGGRTT